MMHGLPPVSASSRSRNRDFRHGLLLGQSPNSGSAPVAALCYDPDVTCRVRQRARSGWSIPSCRTSGDLQPINAKFRIALPMTDQAKRFVRDEQGQDVIEYALLATFIALLAIVGATQLGTALNNWFGTVAGNVNGAAGSAS
jgi:Flp pilus assembly pilin Flp